MSDDGEQSLTIIAFIGSVFSPYYARARRHAAPDGADPLNHCALNVAMYGRAGARWTMTERGRAHVARDAGSLQIGPSALRWNGDDLRIEIDEITTPWPSRLQGHVTVHLEQRFDRAYALAPQHRWIPIAPAARIDVDLGGRRWSGNGYLDSNQGDCPLEQTFIHWDWSRALMSGGRSAVFYDVDRCDAAPLHLGLRFDPDGSVEAVDPPPPAALPATAWRIPRHARGDAIDSVKVLSTLTDAPFYARSLLDARWLGEPVKAMHESLSLTRFDTAWVQAMLPFRMPRRS